MFIQKINFVSMVKILVNILLLLILGILIIFGISTRVFAEDIVLKMDVSHFRNTDRTYLTFKKKTAELATNAFQIDPQNKKQHPQLGRFVTPLTSTLRSVKSMFSSYHRVLVNSKPFYLPQMSKLKSKGKKTRMISMIPIQPPHTPILHLNNQKVDYNHPYFSDLKMTLDEIRKRDNWICLRCVEYRRRGRSILRKIGGRAQKREERRTFSMEELNCRRLDRQRFECIDPQFGIFEIM